MVSKKLIEDGQIQQEIEESAISFQDGLDSKENILVGVNKFKSNENSSDTKLPKEENLQERIDYLKLYKKNRDSNGVESSLRKLEENALSGANLIPIIIDCADNHCTLGEIIFTLKKVFGNY